MGQLTGRNFLITHAADVGALFRAAAAAAPPR